MESHEESCISRKRFFLFKKKKKKKSIHAMKEHDHF